MNERKNEWIAGGGMGEGRDTGKKDRISQK